jgi:hypothetical protein
MLLLQLITCEMWYDDDKIYCHNSPEGSHLYCEKKMDLFPSQRGNFAYDFSRPKFRAENAPTFLHLQELTFSVYGPIYPRGPELYIF